MKKVILYPFLFLIGLQSGIAQTTEWAPVGAQWRYDSWNHGFFSSAVIQTITQDTIINGRTTKQFVQEYYDKTLQPRGYSDTFYVAEDSGRLYLLRSGNFYKFYDLAWVGGDTVSIPGVDYYCPDTVGRQVLLDTGHHVVGGKPYRYSQFDYFDTYKGWQITSWYYYFHIGGSAGILPEPVCIIDGGYLELICYRDSIIPGLFIDPSGGALIDTTGVCDLYAPPIIGIQKHGSGKFTDLQVQPNPAQDHVNVTVPMPVHEARLLLVIRNLAGQEVQSNTLKGAVRTWVDVGSLPSGLYLVEVWGTDGLVGRAKFVKQ